MSDRIIEFSASQFELGAKRLVARLFEVNRSSPDVSCRIPVITWIHGFEYDPHAPPEQHRDLERLCVKALLARKWFEGEAPRWMQPLPLSEDERVALYERGDGRLAVVANYGMMLQDMHWDLGLVTPFIDYYAQSRG